MQPCKKKKERKGGVGGGGKVVVKGGWRGCWGHSAEDNPLWKPGTPDSKKTDLRRHKKKADEDER